MVFYDQRPETLFTKAKWFSMTSTAASQSNPFQMSPTYGFQVGNTIYSPFYFNSPSCCILCQEDGLIGTSASSISPPSTPFTFCKINGNINVCTGCHNKYNKNPVPPDDMCIRHQEWREYTQPLTQIPQGWFANV